MPHVTSCPLSFHSPCHFREDDTEEDDLPKAKRSKQASKGSAKLNMFFQEKEESHDALLPHKFFKERGLSVATKL